MKNTNNGEKVSKETSSTGTTYETRGEAARTGAKIGTPFTFSFDVSVGVRATYTPKKMNNKIEISKFDIKASQAATWAFTLLFFIASTCIIFFSFTLNGLYVFLLVLFITIIVNYASSKMWNIWYEDGFIVMQNLYRTKKVEVSQFRKIEMISIFNNGYTLDLNNGETYQFKITPTEDLKLFFKSDPQFYAKQMTERLNELKQNPARPNL